MYEERIGNDKEGAGDCPFKVGDYIVLTSGCTGIVREIFKGSIVMSFEYIFRRHEGLFMYNQVGVSAYKRHATDNEIGLMKLYGLYPKE